MLFLGLAGRGRLFASVATLTALCLAIPASAQAPTAPYPLPLHRALRLGDTAIWRAQIDSGADLTARDESGNTPLHLAALADNADAVDALLAHHADAAPINRNGATPLHYATGSERIVAALLAHGAPADTAAKTGLTPLFGAVLRPESFGVVRQLVAAGANVNAHITDSTGTPTAVLATAVGGGDPRTIALLVEKGAEVNVKRGSSPLAAAAFMGDVAATRLFLEHGADVNYDSGFSGPALNFAFYSGHDDVAQLLIEHGADLQQKSPQGYATPPIIFSAYHQTSPALARQIIEHGIDVNATNEAGETALTYALRSGPDTPLVRYLHEVGAKLPPAPARAKPTADRTVPVDIIARTALLRESAQRAVDLLQRNSTTFLNTGFVRDQAKCISCHQQELPAVAFGLARDRGLRVDDVALGHQLHAQFAMWSPRAENARQMDEPVPDSSISLGFGAEALHALNAAPDDVTAAMSTFLLAAQRPGGWWPSFDVRPPLENGPVIGTAWAVRFLQLFPPPGRSADVGVAMRRSGAWLAAQQPSSPDEQVFQLRGLLWTGENPAALQPLVQRILANQRADGGWAQLPGLDCDAWATGSTLVALHEAGLATVDTAYQRGVEFLLRTQFDDGSWWVRSRTWPFQPHFDGHFPHGKDQWISAAGTAWATMALLLTINPQGNSAVLPNAQALIAKFLSSSQTASGTTVAATPTVATDRNVAGVSFTRDIKPVIDRSCADCHIGEKVRGDFNLASREGLLKGGQSGDPAVVPGRSSESHLLRYISDQVEDLEMPPLNHREKYPPLTAEEIARVRAWIESGATWGKTP